MLNRNESVELSIIQLLLTKFMFVSIYNICKEIEFLQTSARYVKLDFKKKHNISVTVIKKKVISFSCVLY